MNSIDVSVVITCYNYGKYLKRCLESVLSQAYQNYEIVIVNDGSTDNTEQVIKTYLSDPKIKYIKQKNSGQAKALNVGIRQTRGRFVAFIDADDIWEKTKLEKQIPLFKDSDVGVVYSGAAYIDEQGMPVDFKLRGKQFFPRRGYVSDFLYIENFIPFCSSVVRKECFEEFGLIDENLSTGTDWDLWLRLSTRYKFNYVNDALVFYRMHGAQMSRNTEEMHKSAEKIMRKFIQKFPGAVSAYAIRRANTYTYCNRGDYYRKIDRWKSTFYFLMALKTDPIDAAAYKGLIKNILYW